MRPGIDGAFVHHFCHAHVTVLKGFLSLLLLKLRVYKFDYKEAWGDALNFEN
jgi:hypothetical protein